NLHIRVVKIRNLRFPVGVFEFEEQRAEHGRIVERSIGNRRDVFRSDARTGFRRIAILSSAEASGETTSAPTAARATGPARSSKSTASPLAAARGLEELACRGAFLFVQPPVAVLVELCNELAFLLAHESAGPARAASESARATWPEAARSAAP